MTSSKLLTAFATMLVTISVHCMAQPEPGRLKGIRPPDEMGRPALQQLNVYDGQAGDWMTNDDYVVNDFYPQTTQGKLLVKFPPHMGNQLIKAIKAGSTIAVNGTGETTPYGNKEIGMISITANGQAFQIRRPLPHLNRQNRPR